MKMLQTAKEVEGQLKLLQNGSFSNTRDPHFANLVWFKISEASPESVIHFKPAHAVVTLSIALLILIWSYFQPVRVSMGPVSEVPIVGAILNVNSPMNNQFKPTVEEGNLFTTGAEETISFFLPGAGYFNLAENSKAEIRKARQNPKTGGFHYELYLEEGELYSRLIKLNSASKLNYFTPSGAASVFGTDFLLSVKKDASTSVEVLDGAVDVQSLERQDQKERVFEGSQALISPNLGGNLLLTEIKGPQLAELREKFIRIFEGSDSLKLRERSESNFECPSQSPRRRRF